MHSFERVSKTSTGLPDCATYTPFDVIIKRTFERNTTVSSPPSTFRIIMNGNLYTLPSRVGAPAASSIRLQAPLLWHITDSYCLKEKLMGPPSEHLARAFQALMASQEV
jgi:hypothetical protein